MGVSACISCVLSRAPQGEYILTSTGKPGLGYQKLAQHRHRDVFEREWAGDYDDRKYNRMTMSMFLLIMIGYISSWDGKISKLVVQAVDDIYDGNTTSTYRRTFIRNSSPFYLRLANWPFNHIDPNKNNGQPTSGGEIHREVRYSLC